ncbi:hypothetical protein BsWGS_21044 [Bradybaena similaris]
MTSRATGRQYHVTRGSALNMAALVIQLWILMSVTASRERNEKQANKDFDNELNITSKEKVLIKKLIERYQRQGKEGRPVINTTDSVRVEFGLSLIQILDVDVKNQILKTNVWYEYSWQDVLLRWDKTQYENISDVRIPSDQIWLPDILLYNFADDRLREQRNALVVVQSDGTVLWMPQAILRSSCAFDTLYFPLDEQICILKFGSWTYNGFRLDIDFKSNRKMFEMGSYIKNHEWEIIENSGHKNIKKYTCCPEPYPDLKFVLRLRRRVAFYTLILIMPCALLSLLTMVIFWVPPESPAKLTLGMNIFLAFFVLLLLLADSTPKAAVTIPLIGAYFCLNMIMITMSEILACVVANMHFRGVRINRVPQCLRLVRLLDNGVDKRDCLDSECRSCGDPRGGRYTTAFQFPPIGDEFLAHSQANLQITEELRSIRELLEKVRDKKAKTEEKEKLAREWRVVAIVTDRIIFSVYVMINLMGLLVIFIWQIFRDELIVKGFNDM